MVSSKNPEQANHSQELPPTEDSTAEGNHGPALETPAMEKNTPSQVPKDSRKKKKPSPIEGAFPTSAQAADTLEFPIITLEEEETTQSQRVMTQGAQRLQPRELNRQEKPLDPIQRAEPSEKGKQASLKHSWTSMQTHFNFLFGWLFRRFFKKVSMTSEHIEQLQKAAKEGTLVYIVRNRSHLNYMLYNELYNRYDLPLSRFAQGLYWLPWLPVPRQMRAFLGWAKRALGFGKSEPRKLFHGLVQQQESTLLFLQGPTTWYNHLRKGFYKLRNQTRQLLGFKEALGGSQFDLKEAFIDIVRLQRMQERPIFLCPQILVWDRTPLRSRRTLWDIFLGEREYPGLLRESILFLRDRKESQIRGGPPINVKAFLEETGHLKDKHIARKLRWLIKDRLHREHRVVTGPVLRDAEELKSLILRSSKVQSCIRQTAEEQSISPEKVRQRAHKILDRMAAQPSMLVSRLVDWALLKVWKLIYREIDFDQPGMEEVRQAAMKAPLILLPNHQSHIDYLILSQIFRHSALMIPHIAAGDNLIFPIVGWIFRRCGAFFIRRSFGDDKLYRILFTEYVKRILREGHHIEFFIEGGRSRSGKLRRPKMGMLSMITESVLDKRIRDLYLVPIAISYEKLIEAESHTRELLGATKKKESVGALLSASSILNLNFGGIYVSFAKPISLKKYIEQQVKQEQIQTPNYDPESNNEDRRHLNRTLAYRIVYDINRVMQVSSTAMVATILSTHHRRGLNRKELIRKVEWLRDLLIERGAKVKHFEDATEMVDFSLVSLAKIIKTPKNTFEPVYRPRENRRIELGYYRNQLVHLFLSEGVVTCSLLAFQKQQAPGHGVDKQKLLDAVRFLSYLLKREFIYKPSEHIQENFEETIELMRESGVLSCPSGRVRSAPQKRDLLFFFQALFSPFIDGYWVAALSLFSLRPQEPSDPKELLHQMQKIAETLYHEGHLRYSDTVSNEALKNALEQFQEMKIIRRQTTDSSGKAINRKHQPFLLEDDWTDDSLLKNLVEKIGQFTSCDIYQPVTARMIALQRSGKQDE